MFAVLYVAAALTWDRGRVAARGLPVLTLALFGGALLSKESAVTFPVFVLLVGYLDRSRRPSRAEWLRGYVPMVAMALIWFLVLRPMVLGDAGFRPLGHFGLRWAAKLAADQEPEFRDHDDIFAPPEHLIHRRAVQEFCDEIAISPKR